MASPGMVKVSLPSDRQSLEVVCEQRRLLTVDTVVPDVLDSVPTASTVLNMRRQIVFANRAMLQLAEAETEDAIRGRRPGEALNCIHAIESADGCGTTEFCRTCGAAHALSAGEAGYANAQECRMTRLAPDGNKVSVELLVSVKPIKVAGESFLSCALSNLSHERRRRALERVFFHDLLNSAAGLMLSIDAVGKSKDPKAIADSVNLLRECSSRLVAEIQSHENLLAAEGGELKVRPSLFGTLDMLTIFFEQYQQQFHERNCTLCVAEESEDISICCDQTLMGRVLGNMLKNALEASKAGDIVTLGARKVDNRFEIWVQNPQFISPDVQHQIFQRSFSTKGSDRGLGTYSMRLLSERYLRGTVGFTSDKLTGTTFFARYPIE